MLQASAEQTLAASHVLQAKSNKLELQESCVSADSCTDTGGVAHKGGATLESTANAHTINGMHANAEKALPAKLDNVQFCSMLRSV